MAEREPALRLFVAVEVPAEVRAAAGRLTATGRRVLPGVRWVETGNLHLTVKFIGSAPRRLVAEASPPLAGAARGVPAFEIAVRGLGAFPSPRRPRVVFVDVVSGAAELRSLMEAVEAALVPLGIPREGREPAPHLTLGRVKTPPRPGAVEAWFREAGGCDLGCFAVREVVLMSSRLSPAGPEYEPLERFPLGGGAAGAAESTTDEQARGAHP